MLRRHEEIHSGVLGRKVQVLAFGNYGAPVIAFPSGGGRYHDFEGNGMIGAVSHLIDSGKLKVYCPEGLDKESWLNDGIEPHWRAVRHQAYEQFIVKDLVPSIRNDCDDPDIRIGMTGCSLGAFHAVNFALKFPHLFNYVLAMSGRYDAEELCGAKSDSSEIYFNNPLAYAYHLHGDALEKIRTQTRLTLVCGQGPWEDGNLEDTNKLADLFVEKGIPHERDIWGHDVEHSWNWWRRQINYHFSKEFGN